MGNKSVRFWLSFNIFPSICRMCRMHCCTITCWMTITPWWAMQNCICRFDDSIYPLAIWKFRLSPRSFNFVISIENGSIAWCGAGWQVANGGFATKKLCIAKSFVIYKLVSRLPFRSCDVPLCSVRNNNNKNLKRARGYQYLPFIDTSPSCCCCCCSMQSCNFSYLFKIVTLLASPLRCLCRLPACLPAWLLQLLWFALKRARTHALRRATKANGDQTAICAMRQISRNNNKYTNTRYKTWVGRNVIFFFLYSVLIYTHYMWIFAIHILLAYTHTRGTRSIVDRADVCVCVSAGAYIFVIINIFISNALERLCDWAESAKTTGQGNWILATEESDRTRFRDRRASERWECTLCAWCALCVCVCVCSAHDCAIVCLAG